VRQGQDEKWYNFVNATEILPHQCSKFRVKINKAPNGNQLMIGFCTSAGLGIGNNQGQPESAYYFCGGYMREGGAQSSIGVVSTVGDVVEAEAELGAGVLRWWRNGALLKESAVP
jgi:hypothetical protein